MSSFELIDWALVGRSALWILGLALVLACLSMAHYWAQERRVGLPQVLAEAGYQRGLNGGLALVSLGVGLGSRSWWEAAIWVILCIGFLYLVWRPR